MREDIRIPSPLLPWNSQRPEERVNFKYKQTGVHGILFISKAAASHNVRVKYMVRGGGPSISLSVCSDPEIMAGESSDDKELKSSYRDHERDIREWIIINQKIIKDFWEDDQMTVSDLMKEISILMRENKR